MTRNKTIIRYNLPLLTGLIGIAAHPALADDATGYPTVDVKSFPPTLSSAPLTTSTFSREDIRARQHDTSDTSGLLSRIPGVSANMSGGFSSMPAIRGLSEQRLNILVDGHPIDMACPNDMNTPLSYTDPQSLGDIRVVTGVSPVSMGGDSIGGVIAVEGPAPRFAMDETLLVTGEASAYYRSNDDGFGGAVSLTTATQNLSATYTGSYTQADNYTGGGDRGLVRSTEYAKTDHALAIAYKNDLGLFKLKGGYHFSPYEGFVNQYMDMTSNKSWFLNGEYLGTFDWGTLDLKGDYRATDHEMNFLADKGGIANDGMPMNTRVRSGGYTLKADINVSDKDTLRLGNEYHHQFLNDWWPPVPGSMMMGPNTYININHAHRNRLAFFGEWESKWSSKFSSLIGARFDRVSMNTGDVQPYSPTGMLAMDDVPAANAFNAADHKRRDNNWSGSVLLSYTPSDSAAMELGYAHKVRSPNLYERYSWGRSSMTSRMIGWYGDGNGYVGNLALKPERADTVSAAVEFHGGGEDGWSVKVAPYYTHVSDYIDAVRLKDFLEMGVPTGFVQLQFANQKAEFYGVDLSGSAPVWNGGSLGVTHLSGSLSYIRGNNLSDGGPLYHQMPLDVKMTVSHKIGGLEGAVDVEWVAEKTRVDVTRNEPTTNDYALVNLRTAYSWKIWRLSFDIQNLFDKGYDLPLGGISLGDYKYSGRTLIRPVPGRGRSVNLGLSVSF